MLSTYLVCLRFMRHRADLTKEDYQQAINEVRAYLAVQRMDRPHLGQFLDAWQPSTGP